MEEENVFFFLLAARWLSLLPPAISLFRASSNPIAQLAMPLIFGLAVGSNLLLSIFHPRLNRLLQRHPFLLGFDLALVIVFISMTGGTRSPYGFYALTPLLAAAYFFQVRGGLIAATVFTPLYLLAVNASQLITGTKHDIVEALTRILSALLTTLAFGYLSLLLQRMRETTADLQKTQEELARIQTLAAMGKLVGFLSHEIRNPLATVGGYAHQIRRKVDNPAAVERYAGVIIDETHRLEELLTDMLDLSRPARPTRQPVKLHEILDRACLLAGSELQPASQIKIEKRYDELMPVIEANSASLLRAFLNVIRNGIQFTPEGGTLTISTWVHQHEIEVIIADSGPGIPADVLPNIFTPFVTHRPQGTGLGLVVAQQVIEEHGGRIEAHSDEGKGARFIFHLPLGTPPSRKTVTA